MTCTCGHEMIRRVGRFGDFWGCSSFPRCKKTVPIRGSGSGSNSTSTATSKYGPFGSGSTLPATRVSDQPTHSRSKFSFNPERAAEAKRAPVTFGSGLGSTSTSTTRRIAYAAFNKAIADEISQKISIPHPYTFTGTEQQQAIWAELDRGFTEPTPRHLCVIAGPGTAKTTSCIQWFALAREAGHAIEVQATTYHSLGFAMCRRALEGQGVRVKVNKWKVSELIDEICRLNRDLKDYKRVVKAIKQLVSGCKSSLSSGEPGAIDAMVDYYNIDIPDDTKEKWIERIYTWVPELLAACRKRVEDVDFDDMLWLPVVNGWGLNGDGFDDLFTDECFIGDTPVTLPDYSPLSIKEIVDSRYSGKVLSYDPATKSSVCRRVTGWHKIPLGKKLLRIKTRRVLYLPDGSRASAQTEVKNGYRILITTADQLVMTDNGWREAQSLRLGDFLIEMSDELWRVRLANSPVLCEVVLIDEFTPQDPYVYDIDVEGTHTFYASGIAVHNCQDTAPIQRKLARLACPNGRMIGVGDPRQSIYCFRGASLDAIDEFISDFSADPRGLTTLPLTITQRCPSSHVELATRLFRRDKLQSVPEAPAGIWKANIPPDQAIRDMRPGDMVLCRVRRTLIPTAYALLKRGVKAVVRGRDFGTDLIEWARGLEHDGTVAGLVDAARAYYEIEREKLVKLGIKGESRLDALTDRHECFVELCLGGGSSTRTPEQVFAKIDQLFSDDRPENVVLLSTIHSGKGLEGGRVWILNPELLPYPKATGWQLEQEYNLLWVAVTRGKWDRADVTGKPGELYFVGPLPKPLELDEDGNGNEDEEIDTGQDGDEEYSIPDSALPTQQDIADTKADRHDYRAFGYNQARANRPAVDPNSYPKHPDPKPGTRYSCKCKLCGERWTTTDPALVTYAKHVEMCDKYVTEYERRRERIPGEPIVVAHGRLTYWNLEYKPIVGVLNPDKKCDARCTGAAGNHCECACGGKNHGRDRGL